jgi:hypothetical protein
MAGKGGGGGAAAEVSCRRGVEDGRDLGVGRAGGAAHSSAKAVLTGRVLLYSRGANCGVCMLRGTASGVVAAV